MLPKHKCSLLDLLRGISSTRCTDARKSDSSTLTSTMVYQNRYHFFYTGIQPGRISTYQHSSDAVQQPKDAQASLYPSSVSRPSLTINYDLLQTKRYQPLASRRALNHRLVGTSDNANAEHVLSPESPAYKKKPRHSACDDRY